MAEHALITTERRPEGTASAPGRRSLFAAAPLLALALAGPAHAVDVSADAELIRLCGLFQAAHDASYAANDLPDADDDNGTWAIWLEERTRLQGLILPLSATTPAGQRAKARAALTLMDENNTFGMCNDTLLTYSVLASIVGDEA